MELNYNNKMFKWAIKKNAIFHSIDNLCNERVIKMYLWKYMEKYCYCDDINENTWNDEKIPFNDNMEKFFHKLHCKYSGDEPYNYNECEITEYKNAIIKNLQSLNDGKNKTIIVLNDHKFFKNSFGDAIFIFMVVDFDYNIWVFNEKMDVDYKLYVIGCDGSMELYVDSEYSNNETLMINTILFGDILLNL